MCPFPIQSGHQQLPRVMIVIRIAVRIAIIVMIVMTVRIVTISMFLVLRVVFFFFFSPEAVRPYKYIGNSCRARAWVKSAPGNLNPKP